MKQLIGKIKLIPHFELEPNDFRKKKKKKFYNTPRRERAKLWKESFTQAGIEGLTLIEPQHPRTPVRDIYHPLLLEHIYALIQRETQKVGEPGDKLLGHIAGGLSLTHDGEVIVASTCCSDLGNIKDWRQAVSHSSSNWQMLWNGHPWIYIRYQDGEYQLTDYTETESRVAQSAKYVLSAPALQAAVEQAENEISEFKQRFLAFIEAQDAD